MIQVPATPDTEVNVQADIKNHWILSLIFLVKSFERLKYCSNEEIIMNCSDQEIMKNSYCHTSFTCVPMAPLSPVWMDIPNSGCQSFLLPLYFFSPALDSRFLTSQRFNKSILFHLPALSSHKVTKGNFYWQPLGSWLLLEGQEAPTPVQQVLWHLTAAVTHSA